MTTDNDKEDGQHGAQCTTRRLMEDDEGLWSMMEDDKG